jgi:hypothetical protein
MRVLSGLALLLLGASLGYGLSRLFPSGTGSAGKPISQRPTVLERRGGETSERRREPTVSVGYLGEPEKAGRSMWKRSYGVSVKDAIEGQRCTVFVELVVGDRIHAIDTVSGRVGEGGSLSLTDEISDPYGHRSTELRLRGACE